MSIGTKNTKNQGVAIVLVIFIVALASILVINLTYSTFISTRTMGMVERGLQAEYLLKSLLNFSQVLIKEDKNKFDAYQADGWGVFALNPRVPNEYLGLTDQSSEIYLELIPTNSKLNISELESIIALPNSSKPEPLIESFDHLFTELGFEDKLSEPDNKKVAGGKVFSIREVIGNLIDWQDRDSKSFDTPYATGSESEVDKKYITNKKFGFFGQLATVPGMTPRRVNAIAPYVTTHGSGESTIRGININVASDQVLLSVSREIDETIVESIRSHIESDGPFESTSDINNASILPPGFAVGSTFNVQSNSFDIYAKIKFGLQRAYYLKARITRGRSGTMPRVLYSIIY